MAEKFLNYVAGEWVAPATGEYIENRNPARTSDLIGLFPDTGAAELDAAVASAQRGFERWSRTPAPERGLVLKAAGDLLTRHKEDLARTATREMGKVLDETRGDVQEAIDTAYYAAVEGRRLFGRTAPSELRSKWAMSFRRPIGVFGIITPFNFPVAVPSWKILPALLCGNSIIYKPSEDVPHSAHRFVEILLEAGLPPECVQLLHGCGETIGRAIVEHPGIPGLSFTGSTETGSRIGEVAGRLHKRLSLEMGGKNAQIVMSDADLDLALEGVLWGAFGTTGQRCTATSRLLVQNEVHDEFVEKLCYEARSLRLGDGQEAGVDVGPLIHEAAREKCERYIAIARDEGATVATGGGRPAESGLADGWFFEPTVLAGVDRAHRAAREEIFGPVLSVIRFDTIDEAFDINNEVPYGLSSSIYTRDVTASFRAVEELDNGITYVNAPTIGAEAHLPFGGVKNTGNGHREGGWEVYEFYTETKVAYVDYSGTLQRAQIDVDW
ncbi:MAG: aldehyde dehydrogenase family protein [Gemmatimonadales bacterium]|nr:aldehyde dehydrogenase family protein [Gemmatimonadales bacterium]MYG19841.1 aldehyde dehydrogenase family protein [Gemmatimonadales bacterium]